MLEVSFSSFERDTTVSSDTLLSFEKKNMILIATVGKHNWRRVTIYKTTEMSDQKLIRLTKIDKLNKRLHVKIEIQMLNDF